MTQEEILKYNKRCAEFLGYQISENKECFKISNENGWITLDVFHSDWNWIMEVVKAIEKLKFNVRITCTCITIENAFENDSNLSPIHKFHSIQGEFETKEEAIVEAINQFLIWYNENKTN